MTSNGRTKIYDCSQGDEAMKHQRPVDIPLSNFKFGYGSLKPLWLQRANRAPVLLAALCICAICQGSIVNGFISTSISSLEKRFSLSSTQSGIFSSFYDVAVVLVLIPLSHFGNKCHKGRVIATGMVLVGIGSILLILPHFFAGKYSVGEQRQTVCNSSPSEDVCLEGVTGVSAIWFYILLASQLLIGVGAAPLFTLGIYMAMSTIGPAIGFIAGGQLLKIWGDIGKSDYRHLSISGTSDPRWYGAWWIGFAIAGAFSLLSSIPLFGFPKELPEKQRHRLKDVKQTHKDLDKDFGKSLADYPKIVLTLIRNPSVMALMAMQTSEAFLMNGFITFIPKVFENLFAYSASFSSTITGIIVVPMGLFGSLFGAILAKKTLRFQPTIALAIIFNVCALCFSFVFLHECEQKPFAGVTHDYTGAHANSTTFKSSCNDMCHCTTIYDPVCNPETGISYYSPCFAGCLKQQYNDDGSPKDVWESCACVSRHLFNSTKIPTNGNIVQKGLCRSECAQTLFFIVFACLCFFTFSSAIPIQNASLRVVSFDTRDVAIGLTWLFMRIFAIGMKTLIIFFLSISYYFYKQPSDDDINEKKATSNRHEQRSDLALAVRQETSKTLTGVARTYG
ncbi:Solute carrier organic anion transporter family member 4C1 [Toxocara canis]|uniref:Solute carrier organic anion transporter family member n=1 Tax=Toxocara canis TaxID=6265 RepID=A0A0B2W0T1_TOXCA|nr:Solute carrier organic anion transporter family member 4C1 [Toxocara canis]